jgi:4'-phosphopantetheinyl transferase EntD
MLIELNQSALQAYFGAVCTAPIFITHRHSIADVESFTLNEKNRICEFASEKRKVEYILGRYALKDALACIGRDADTSAIMWPSAFCSLSHSEGNAVAVSSLAVQGIGIDLQLNRTPSFEVANRILSGQTLEFWHKLNEPDKAKTLQRLWTANEAIYKACPAPQPAYFRHYRVHTPDLMESQASIDRTPYQFMLYSAELANGFISIAIRQA